MNLWESPFKSIRTAAILAGALGVVVFLNALGNDFAYDDVHIVLENEGIQSLETLPQALVEPYWPGELGTGLGLWRPMVTGAFGLQWALWGETPGAFHLVNVLLHGAVTALVVLLLGGLLPVSGAFLAGLLFALHPVHVEAVANVVGLAEVQAAFFFLLAALLIQRGGLRLSSGRLLLILLSYALAFLTKESAITLVGVVLLLDSSREDLTLTDLPEYLRKRWPLYAGLILVAGIILYTRYRILGSLASPFAPLGAHLLDEVPRIWTVAGSWPHLFRLLFFPLDLSADYGPAVIPIALGWNMATSLGAILVLATLVFALFAWPRGPLGSEALKPRIVGWGVVWFLITLSPTSNLVFLSGILLSERTLYLPSVGFVAALAWLLLRFREDRPRLGLTVVVVILALMACRSWTRTPTWKDNGRVFTTMMAHHPESGRSQWVMGDIYFQRGQISAALRSYRLAIGILGGHYTLLTEVGRRLMGEGYDGAAEVLLTFAWEDWPEMGFAPGLLATVYHRQGRMAEAAEAARASLAQDPAQPVQHHILSEALEALGELEGAREARLAAIRLGEGEHWEQWVWLAELEVARGDTLAAREALDSARALPLSEEEVSQIGRFEIQLGLRSGPDSLSESARDSHYPRPEEGDSP